MLGYAALAAIVGWWTWRALHAPLGLDFRLYHTRGQLAWAPGHPEHQATWDGTPALAAAMAIVTRLMSLRTAAGLMTVLNTALVVSVAAVVLRRLRGQLSQAWWWMTALGLLSFGPIMSTVWWKQFNIVALALAVAGFESLRRRRTQSAAVLIGLSISIKPLVFLLPLVMLARRETRRAGALALAWVAAINFAALALLAFRAHNLAVISPIPSLRNFIDKAQPSNVWACQSENFAPGSLLCRLVGHQDRGLQHIVVLVVVALLGACAIHALRGRGPSSWDAFAFICPLSVMLSPLAWTHYQIMLAPLFVLLVFRFTRDGAGFGAWAGLAVAFILASVMWQPYGTVIDAVRGLVSVHRNTARGAEPVADLAQFAQYVLVIIGVLWYARARRAAESARSVSRAS